MRRDTIFIGHATPEDNEFTLWLQSKLINEGYKSECDLTLLLGGEADYWKNLQQFLAQRTAKYILVVSKHTFDKSGVLDEWEYCRSLERQFAISDFIIPVKVDDSPFNARIGLNRRNIIPFEEFWGSGLKRLLKKLSNDCVERSEAGPQSLAEWYKNVYTNSSGIDRLSSDIFFSNWLSIPVLPSKLYFYQFDNDAQAVAVLNNNLAYSGIRHGNLIITFQGSLNYYLSDKQFDIQPSRSFVRNCRDALEYYPGDDFPTFHDFRRLLVRLLKQCFRDYLSSIGLMQFELSNNTTCFYFRHDESNRVKGRFFIHDQAKYIGVTGRYYDSFWHYAISCHPLLQPEVCFSLRSHIIFSDDGATGWTDARKMHSARRDKGKTMRNKEWRDLLLAFLACIKDDFTGKIIVPVASNEVIALPATPIKFRAEFGYIEPNDESRIQSIDTFIEEEDYYDSLDEGGEHV